ncbi:SH3 beta-barrel fold-containing protein [Bacteroides sp. 51]|uniref:SH3 beta-barrel fold-containing protein n=1 Tax=Bacteroides sp. 51 TaxID=2302938 RepID=UPI0013D61392|nr:SH3 beta-barrel fold-containing protein [Bacteroides sp. 51]
MKTSFKNQLSEVMTDAWQLVRGYNFSKSHALEQSWKIQRLNQLLMAGTARFFYLKENGCYRLAYGTLKPELIPQAEGSDSGKKKSDSVVVYYDCEKQAFRSFKKAYLLWEF